MNTEKNLTIEEIESVIGEEPIFYLKFTSKESFANDVVEGKLYANSIDHFSSFYCLGKVSGLTLFAFSYAVIIANNH